jgi:hypothetical protein
MKLNLFLMPAALVNAAACVETAPFDLKTASNYAILAKSGISNVPTSASIGSIGVSPSARIGEIERSHDLATDAVTATDIADKDLMEERNARWASVFAESAHLVRNVNQLKATLVLDHPMQAADVAHIL